LAPHDGFIRLVFSIVKTKLSEKGLMLAVNFFSAY